MKKSEFKILRSGFRKLSGEAYSEANVKAFKSGGNALDYFGRILNAKQSDFINKTGVNFLRYEKTTARDLLVSMRIVRALDYPSWAFSLPYSFN